MSNLSWLMRREKQMANSFGIFFSGPVEDRTGQMTTTPTQVGGMLSALTVKLAACGYIHFMMSSVPCPYENKTQKKPLGHMHS